MISKLEENPCFFGVIFPYKVYLETWSMYTIIGISITSKTRSWNDITIPIHLFDDNNVIED